MRKLANLQYIFIKHQLRSCFLLGSQHGFGGCHPDCLFGGPASAEAGRHCEGEAKLLVFDGAFSLPSSSTTTRQSTSPSSTGFFISTSPSAQGRTGKTGTRKGCTPDLGEQAGAARCTG